MNNTQMLFTAYIVFFLSMVLLAFALGAGQPVTKTDWNNANDGVCQLHGGVKSILKHRFGSVSQSVVCADNMPMPLPRRTNKTGANQ